MLTASAHDCGAQQKMFDGRVAGKALGAGRELVVARLLLTLGSSQERESVKS